MLFPKTVAIKSGNRLSEAKRITNMPRLKMSPSTGIIRRFDIKNKPGNWLK